MSKRFFSAAFAAAITFLQTGNPIFAAAAFAVSYAVYEDIDAPQLSEDTGGVIRSSVQNGRWGIGEVRDDGVLAWFGNYDRTMHMVFALSYGECESLEELVIDGVHVPLIRRAEAGETAPQSAGYGNSFTLSGAYLSPADGTEYGFHRGFNPVRVFEFFKADGTQGEEIRQFTHPSSLPSRNPNTLPWTTDHRMSNISYVYVRLVQGKTVDGKRKVFRNVPKIEFVYKGLKLPVYDAMGVRTDDVAWTDNPADVRRWWLTERRGVPDSRIHTGDYLASRALCNSTVNYTDANSHTVALKRYTFNGVITSADSPTRVEAQMNWDMNGIAPIVDGEHRIRAGGERPQAVLIDGDDILTEPIIRPGRDATETANQLTVVLPQSKRDNFLSASVTIDDDEAQRVDGRVNTQSPIKLDYVNDPVLAGNIVRSRLATARAAITVEVICKFGKNSEWSIVSLTPGDKVGLYLPQYGLGEEVGGEIRGKDFWVVLNDVQSDRTVKLILREWPEDRYTDNLLPYDEVTRIGIVAPAVPPPEVLNVEVRPLIDRNQASWEVEVETDESDFDTEFEVVLDPDNLRRTKPWVRSTTEKITLPIIERGTYEINTRRVSRSRDVSDVVSRRVVVAPPPIQLQSGHTAEARGAAVTLKIPVGNINIRGAEIRQIRASVSASPPPLVTDATWDAADAVDFRSVLPTVDNRFILLHRNIGTSGRYSFGVRLADSFGEVSGTISFAPRLLSFIDDISYDFSVGPDFDGTHDQTAVWTHDPSGALLIPSPGAADTVTRASWNGSAGYPFGNPASTSRWVSSAFSLEETRGSMSISLTPTYYRRPLTTETSTPRIEVSKNAVGWTEWTGSDVTLTDLSELYVRVTFREGSTTHMQHGGLRQLEISAVGQ